MRHIMAQTGPLSLILEGAAVCPNCGERADFTAHESQNTETHGLDCGPYETWTERWLVCQTCGAETDERELIGGVK